MRNYKPTIREQGQGYKVCNWKAKINKLKKIYEPGRKI